MSTLSTRTGRFGTSEPGAGGGGTTAPGETFGGAGGSTRSYRRSLRNRIGYSRWNLGISGGHRRESPTKQSPDSGTPHHVPVEWHSPTLVRAALREVHDYVFRSHVIRRTTPGRSFVRPCRSVNDLRHTQ